ncbi:MAG: RNA polymerase sigma factor [Acidobacteriota bacterium]|nr:RNA polymerase sigma factor [Acidobacteriota bacterium]
MSGHSELVTRAQEGDPVAFGCLVENQWTSLVRLARSVVGEAEAEDVVQEGLERAWRKLQGLREPAALGSWLSRIVLRVCFKHLRRRPGELVSLEVVPEPAHEPNPGPELDVGRLLAALPPRQRAVMHLTVIEGMTDSEIAPILGITAGSVRAHRRRARQGLEQRVSRKGGNT